MQVLPLGPTVFQRGKSTKSRRTAVPGQGLAHRSNATDATDATSKTGTGGSRLEASVAVAHISVAQSLTVGVCECVHAVQVHVL